MTGRPPSRMPAAPGLYSIGVRGLSLPELLRWTASVDVPFLHLRGGPRGFDLRGRSPATLRRWRDLAAGTVPITGVATDADLLDFLPGDRGRHRSAAAHLKVLADAAEVLGAGWVRVLAATAPTAAGAPPARVAEVGLPDVAVPVLIEVHHPDWFAPGPSMALADLTSANGRMGLLCDTGQVHRAWMLHGNGVESALARFGGHWRASHLSDSGTGLSGHGHELAARSVAQAVAAGRDVEVAVEWTGPRRDRTTCLARYRAATSWFHALTRTSTPAPTTLAPERTRS
jgi:sugar phosphate isomerase/epimerase